MKKVQGEPCDVCGKTTYRQKTVWYKDKKKHSNDVRPLTCMTCGNGLKRKVKKQTKTHIKFG